MTPIGRQEGADVLGARAILDAFVQYRLTFREITRRGRSRFERREWTRMQRDMVERLDLYSLCLPSIVAQLQEILGKGAEDRRVWQSMKGAYSELIGPRADVELAETFFNSASRRIFSTVGVDPKVEFVASTDERTPLGSPRPNFRTYHPAESTGDILRAILRDNPGAVRWADLDRDIALAAEEIDTRLGEVPGSPTILMVDVLRSVFYRNKGAYIIGRIVTKGGFVPLVIALLNPDDGITIDAVLCSEDEISIVFSFTRSYFHVEVNRPYAMIAFLKSIMPLKPVAELYISLGFNRHGKTIIYRDLLEHLRTSDDRFVPARGEKGMVMLVFTLPEHDLVFKVIRDSFGHSKSINRQEVMRRYDLVFKRDRGGRLIDAQRFEHLRFERKRFSTELLGEFASSASDMITIEEDFVHIRHLYTERRVTPLNLYVREAPRSLRRDAILDYGDSIKDLAVTNIFAGDILLKNFGATRHGRVVCYDYDELCLLEDCNFRFLPQPRDDVEESEGDTWFYVNENDIFPEEFLGFLGIPKDLKEDFLAAHSDLLTPEYYRKVQERHRTGEVIEIFPYKQGRRLSVGHRDATRPA